MSDRALCDLALREDIERVWKENYGVYCVRMVWRQLQSWGDVVARCPVERLMREMGLSGDVRGKRFMRDPTLRT